MYLIKDIFTLVPHKTAHLFVSKSTHAVIAARRRSINIIVNGAVKASARLIDIIE